MYLSEAINFIMSDINDFCGSNHLSNHVNFTASCFEYACFIYLTYMNLSCELKIILDERGTEVLSLVT